MMGNVSSGAGGIEPDRVYSPAGLARAIGRSDRYVYDLCREGLLRHSRTRPGGKGPIAITGAAWLEYRKRCEVGGRAEDAEGEGEGEDANPQHPPPTRSRRRRGRTPAPASKNPWLGYRQGEAG